MPRFLTLAALLLAGCSPQSPAKDSAAKQDAEPAAAAPAPPAVKGVTIESKSDLLEFHLSWPAEVSAIPALVKLISGPAEAHKAELLKTAAADKTEREKQDFPFNGYEFSETYEVAGNTSRLLSLSDDWFEFTGGAHPNHGTKALLWDRDTGKAIVFADLLAGGAAKLDPLLRSSYCEALDKERAEKRGPAEQESVIAPDDPFNQCPKFAELALIPAGSADKPLSKIIIHADPYVAGPYAEGDYDVELPVTADFVTALKNEYRSSFAAR